MEIDVDPGRLSQLAEALGSQGSRLSQAHDELGAASATVEGSCGAINDGGLSSAMQNLNNAWGYDIDAVGSDTSKIGNVMTVIARLYAQADSQGAQALGG